MFIARDGWRLVQRCRRAAAALPLLAAAAGARLVAADLRRSSDGRCLAPAVVLSDRLPAKVLTDVQEVAQDALDDTGELVDRVARIAEFRLVGRL